MSEDPDQFDETPGTSSSQAFSNIQNQTTLGPSRNTRSQSTERFTTPRLGVSPLQQTMDSIAEEIDIRDARRAASLNRPSPGPPDFGDDPDIGSAHNQQNKAINLCQNTSMINWTYSTWDA